MLACALVHYLSLSHTHLFDSFINYDLYFASIQSKTELQETFEQCLTEVPGRFIIGSVNGQFFGSMKKLAQEIIPLALNNQFQEPNITNRISFELDDKDGDENENENELKTNQNIEYPIASIYTSRPSDFRIKSICESMTSEFVDRFNQPINEQTTKTASKSIRKLFDEFIADFNASIERYCI